MLCKSVARLARAEPAGGSRRAVTTTSASKGQQLARQRHQRDPQNEADLDERLQARLDHLNVWQALETIKRNGHRLAALDPLRLQRPDSLDQFTWSHLQVERARASEQLVPAGAFLNTRQALERPLVSPADLLDQAYELYAAHGCGLEYAHISNEREVEWLTREWERLGEPAASLLEQQEQEHLAKLLLKCEAFDHFMAQKFPTTKRYGCEGAESMLVVFDEILRFCRPFEAYKPDTANDAPASVSLDEVVIGMPHRGRLNLLACLFDFNPAAIFSKIRGESEICLREAWMATGDVLSHMSTSGRFVYGAAREDLGLFRVSPEPINVTLLPNPSHLEAISPVVAGVARGRAQNLYLGYTSSPRHVRPDGGEANGVADKPEQAPHWSTLPRHEADYYTRHALSILPIQVHGDASLAGQGIIQESLQMSNLPMFSVGGSLHLVVNNQIGYTTEAKAGRSSRYCTDVFKMIEAPIVHVNAQNIASVVRATRLALAYRQRFAKDVAIDLVCFRRHGHNEMDEPSFTQPLMYDVIRNRSSIPQTFCDRLGMSAQQREAMVAHFKAKLHDSQKHVDVFKPDNDHFRNFSLPSEHHRDHVYVWRTGCDLELLRQVALDSVKTPDNFSLHPTLERVLVNERKSRFGANQALDASTLGRVPVDWATAEIIALGSLLKQNQPVRLAGQDVARGTFSTRHAVLFDQRTGKPHVPLNQLNTEPRTAKLDVANTILSEEAALAYEFGYSIETCALTIWEAQFGDFFNTAQSIIDTLVSSSETKWLKQSALTLLLPHGLDGAGPEHSSARLERFLQMSSSSFDSVDTDAKVNWSICFPTQPSQYFHLLRRQVLRPYRKPLIVMAPKVIFRHPECVSELSLFGPEHSFEPVLDDPHFALDQSDADRNSVDTVVLCSGKVYFQLDEARRQAGIQNVALIRIEELCPFPIHVLMSTLKRYPNIKKDDVVWLQEEHKNQGAYTFVQTRLNNMAKINLRYIGRPESELPATGSLKLHKWEWQQIMQQFHKLDNSTQV